MKMLCVHRYWISFVIGILSGLPLAVVEGGEGKTSVPLQENLGPHTYIVTTSLPLAQRYFDQGLILAYGFNHAEAERSFRAAHSLDPKCAMCYWGEALVLGPNINAPMGTSVMPRAYEAVQNALALTDQEKTTEKERVLIHALAKRYSQEFASERRHLDETYAAAMRGVFQQYPDDAVIGALFAESLMDLHPWDFWTKDGEAKPWTPEIRQTLEHVLQNAPDHPLANHLYIHTMEASPYPEAALPNAERLATLVPGSGHLVHMPGHIYIRIGQYRDAVLANQQAVKVDQRYLRHSHAESLYTAAYVPHNYHFLWAAAIKTGQRALSTQAAKDTAAQVHPEAMRDPAVAGTLQHFWLMPLYTKAMFGQWADIRHEPAPAADLLYPTGIWHYARGLALLRQGELAQAREELALLQGLAHHPDVTTLTIFDLNDVEDILSIAEHILSGEVSASEGKIDSAIDHLQRAVELEDGLNYTEPKDWYLPPRQVLGAIYLEAGKAADAESVYREDLKHHPQNGWSLYGLVQSLQAQGKTEEARETHKQFARAWADADVELQGSRN
ncbi:MAG: hypothetical protein MRJ96_12040 [Nitrospirales bacterium]|nr:tetratricopeptide repeat protein [Nitrospira sp.]MDR4502171.1 hypothetical protein [Nitrospirales bacterium]